LGGRAAQKNTNAGQKNKSLHRKKTRAGGDERKKGGEELNLNVQRNIGEMKMRATIKAEEGKQNARRDWEEKEGNASKKAGEKMIRRMARLEGG